MTQIFDKGECTNLNSCRYLLGTSRTGGKTNRTSKNDIKGKCSLMKCLLVILIHILLFFFFQTMCVPLDKSRKIIIFTCV